MIDALRRARAALPQDPERALGALLEAWRASRSPRVADLVDRVSATVTERRPALPSHPVKERTAAFLALAARGDPAGLGRLLQAPWPGTWKAALPVLEALRGFDDPRLAMALARLVDQTPFDTWTSDNFYRVLFARLDALADLRTLPLLEAGLARSRSTYWRQGTRKREEAAVAALRRRFPQGAPSLTDEEAGELEAMEFLFAGAVRTESLKREGQAGFLADVFARPDDDGLRQVFADWLQERGDPRGEFLALQLARAAGRSDLRSLRREASLQRQHGKAWAGPLDRFLAEDGRSFERGFLAAGALALTDRRSYATLQELPAGMDVPDWATLRSLAFRWDEARQPALVEKVLSLPGLAGLRRVAGLQEPAVAFLAAGTPRLSIEELEFEASRGAWESSPEGLDARAAISSGAGLPGLRRLGVEGEVPGLDWLLDSRLVHGLTRLTLRGYEWPLGPLVREVARRELPLAELACAERLSRGPGCWEFVLRRDAQGRWSRLEARGDKTVPEATTFLRALGSLPEGALTAIRVPSHGACNWSEPELAAAEVALGRFPDAEIDVPWRRVRKVRFSGAPLELSLSGEGLAVGAALERVLALLRGPPVGLLPTACVVDYGAHRPLPGDPLEAVRTTFAKKRPHSVCLYPEGAAGQHELRVFKDGRRLELRVPRSREPGWDEAFVEVAARLVESGQVTEGRVPFLADGGAGLLTVEALSHLATVGWLTVIGPGLLPFFPVEDLEEWARQERQVPIKVARGGGVALVVAGDPEHPDEKARACLERGFAGIFHRRYREVRGFDPGGVIDRVLAPVLRESGFAPVALPAGMELIGRRCFRAAPESGAREVYLELVRPFDETLLRTWLRHAPGEPGATTYTRSRTVDPPGAQYGDLPAQTAAGYEASVQGLAARWRAELLAWFDELPPAPRPRRRR